MQGHRQVLLCFFTTLSTILTGSERNVLVTIPCVSLKDTRPSEAIKKIVEACQASSVVSVVYQKEVTYEEVNVEQNIKNFCKNSGIKVSWDLCKSC